ncbi:hypothetical protein WAI453_007105 [Rhynchosporium graminicola]
MHTAPNGTFSISLPNYSQLQQHQADQAGHTRLLTYESMYLTDSLDLSMLFASSPALPAIYLLCLQPSALISPESKANRMNNQPYIQHPYLDTTILNHTNPHRTVCSCPFDR